MSSSELSFHEYDTRLAAYAVISDERGLLLSWWNGGEHPERAAWALPGGGIDFDEQIEDGLIREIHEETGYRAELTEFLLTDSVTHTDDGGRGRPMKAVRLVYRARITGGTLGTVEVGGSTDRAQWHAWESLRDLQPRVGLVTAVIEALAI